MGKTFCLKHERMYETECEYCEPPAVPAAQRAIPFAPTWPKCKCGELVFDPRCAIAGAPIEGYSNGLHTPEQCYPRGNGPMTAAELRAALYGEAPGASALRDARALEQWLVHWIAESKSPYRLNKLIP